MAGVDGPLSTKVVLISGGASGIGYATARLFVEQGARVALGDVQGAKGAAAAETLGERAMFVDLDVTQEAPWRDAVKAVQARFGALTTVVNSAGVSIPANIEQESLEGFRRTLAINLEGVFLGCKMGVEALKGGTGGAIVNLASTLGVQAGAIFPAYSASKGGVRMLTRAVALHCAEQGYDIRVNAVLPGAIHTEMVEGYIAAGEAGGATRESVIGGFAQAHPMKRLGRPFEPAAAIVFLASDAASFITGADLAVDGGLLA
ncbi:SDR family oxidoreductase [Phenylobacterium sp.]|uniref:SDR family oxidoreductase n=1 Tax=Phenylobacterium sp. TaxID=1871053 RepID=UPI00286AC3B0|nr:SDR family oxidoreductase [Phenylobacterium sp.]